MAAAAAAAPTQWDATNKSPRDIAREKLSFFRSLSDKEEKDLRAASLYYFTSMEDL